MFWNYEFTKQALRKEQQKVETLSFLVSVQDSAIVKHKAIGIKLREEVVPSLERTIKAQEESFKVLQKQKRREKARSFGTGVLLGGLIALLASG